jgi:glutathione S-transferase
MATATRGAASAARLVTIRFSHYAEIARWALDYHQLPYVEAPYLPILSTFGVIAAGGLASGTSDRVSTRFSTPLLVVGTGGRPIHDSRLILAWADSQRRAGSPSLLSDGAEEDVARFHDLLGPHTRRVAYSHLLGDEPLFWRMCEENVGGAQTRVLRAVWPLARRAMHGLGLEHERVAKSRGHILREFDAVGERLVAGGSDFLRGARFTAADVAFASLSAPVLVPQPHEGFGGWLPPVEDLPDGYRDVVRELRAHPAGQHAMRMFRLHRGNRVIPGEPRIDTTPPHDVESGPEDGVGGGRRGGGMGPGVV